MNNETLKCFTLYITKLYISYWKYAMYTYFVNVCFGWFLAEGGEKGITASKALPFDQIVVVVIPCMKQAMQVQTDNMDGQQKIDW